MPTLLYIRDAKEKNLLLLGFNEEGESVSYKVSRDFYFEIGSPTRNEVVGDEVMCEIRLRDEYFRAKAKALSLLSYSDVSERGLCDKLCRAGFSRQVALDVSCEMVSLGYVDEVRQIERLVLDEANRKLRGQMKIIPFLAAKGYSPARVREVMARLVEFGEIDFRKNAKKLIEKKLPPDASSEEKKKLLYRNGFKV